MITTVKTFNKTVSANMVNDFAYKYIHSIILDMKKAYHLPSTIDFDVYAKETYLMLTGYNTKKSTDLKFIANADFYNNVVTLQIINYYDDSASFVEISFDEIKTVIENNELVNYINDYVRAAVENANKLVAEYKKEHNLK